MITGKASLRFKGLRGCLKLRLIENLIEIYSGSSGGGSSSSSSRKVVTSIYARYVDLLYYSTRTLPS